MEIKKRTENLRNSNHVCYDCYDLDGIAMEDKNLHTVYTMKKDGSK